MVYFPGKFLRLWFHKFLRLWFHKMVIRTNVFGTPRTKVLVLLATTNISPFTVRKSDYCLNLFSLQLLDDSSTMLANKLQNGIKLNIPDLLLKHDNDIFHHRLKTEPHSHRLVTTLAKSLNTNKPCLGDNSNVIQPESKTIVFLNIP